MSKPIKPSYCIRCNGIFARHPGAPARVTRIQRKLLATDARRRVEIGLPKSESERRTSCESCGAKGLHWEKRPRAADVGTALPDGYYLQPGYLLLGQGIRDVDGTFVSADELLVARYDRSGNRIDKNYGRRATVMPNLAAMEYDTTHAAGQEVRAGGPRRRRRNDVSVETDFLAGGGWSVQKAGTTGASVGRSPEGITGNAHIAAAVQRVIFAGEAWLGRSLRELLAADAGRADIRGFKDTNGRKGRAKKAARALFVACVLGAGVNAQAYADLLGVDKRTLNRHRLYGEEWISKNLLLLMLTMPRDGTAPIPKNLPQTCPKEGTEEMDATLAAEIIERLE